MYNIIYEMSRQSRFDARYWMLGAGAYQMEGLGREEGCTDLMKVSGRLRPRLGGLCTWQGCPRVTCVLILAGHPAPGDSIHQPAEGDRGEWQGELGCWWDGASLAGPGGAPSLVGRLHSWAIEDRFLQGA